MTARSRNRVLLATVAIAALWLLAASRVHVNASWSDGAWGYLALPVLGDPDFGDVVLFDPPAGVGAGVPYLKTVRGLPGARVEVWADRAVSVDGLVLGIAKSEARDGRPLAAIAPGTVPPGHYFLHGPHRDSHDSRYAEIGFVPRERIRALAVACRTCRGSGWRGRWSGPRAWAHERSIPLPVGGASDRGHGLAPLWSRSGRKGPGRPRRDLGDRRARPAAGARSPPP